MPTHTIDDYNYWTLTDSTYISGSIYPDVVSGSVVTEVIDLTERHRDAVAVSYAGFDIDVYYMTDFSTDWVLCTTPQLTECILIPFAGEINTAYDIAYIENLQFESDYRAGEILNRSGQVGFAKVNYSTIYDGTEETSILTNIFVEDNYIRIGDPSILPARSNITIVYTPRTLVLTDVSRYIIFKVIFKSFDSYLSSITIDFKLDTYHNMCKNMPVFYRRV